MRLADLNEGPTLSPSSGLPRDATRAEMLELQTYLIENVEGSEDIDFDIRDNHAYGLAIHLTHNSDECDVVKVNQPSQLPDHQAWGIRVPGFRFRMSYRLELLVEDVDDWVNGQFADWDRDRK